MSDENKPTTSTGDSPPETGASGQESSGVQQQTPAQEPSEDFVRRADLQKLQSTYDRRVQELEQELTQSQRLAREMQMRDMSDAERLQFERDEAYRLLEMQQRQFNRQRQEMERERDIETITETTGAPRDLVEDAPNAHEAWLRAARWQKEQAQKRSQQQQQRQQSSQGDQGAGTERSAGNDPRNDADLGSGAPQGKAADLQSRYDQAMNDYDTWTALDIMAEADREGVTLRE